MLEATLLIVGAYLVGSIPTGYLAGRVVGGIDVRDYGSRNVGASNVIAHVNPWVGVGVGLFDGIVKGILPAVIGRELLDLSVWIQGAAGFAAIAGHNWSPFLRFTGGRGVATGIGVALGLMMWKEILILGVATLIIGRLLTRDLGFWTFIAMLTLPAVAFVLGKEAAAVWTAVSIGLLLMLKRLTANWETPPPEYALHKVLLYRLVWDRDVPKQVEWTERRPS